jgi:hypothetical protein
MFYERPGISFKTRFIVVTVTVVLTTLFMLGYRYWTTPTVPFFPDVENVDSTINYTLVGSETDYNEAKYPRKRLVAYNKLVVRLPKHLGATRPLAEGGSVTGEGAKLSYSKNLNVALRVGISWRFLATGKTNLSDAMAKPSDESDELSLSIKERPERKWRDRIQSFWKWCKLVEQKPDGFVQYVAKSKQNQFCYRVSSQNNKKEYVLMQDNQPLAFVGCARAIEVSKKYCIVHIYHRDYFFVGDFSGQNVDDFPQVFPSLMAIIDKSIVSQSRIVLE